MLDAIGLQHWLGVTGCAKLFVPDSRVVQTAVILPFPVDVDGAGGSPRGGRRCRTDDRLRNARPRIAAAAVPRSSTLGPDPNEETPWTSTHCFP